jgi:hypothetical protein
LAKKPSSALAIMRLMSEVITRTAMKILLSTLTPTSSGEGLLLAAIGHLHEATVTGAIRTA